MTHGSRRVATAKRSSCQLWDQHGGLKTELPANCAATDGPIAGLLTDLKARGLLNDTIVTAFEDGILERFAATMKGYRSQSKREQLLAQVVATAAA